MKSVFTSREIAHIWANSAAPFGRSPGNASFEGDVFRSYRTVIARRITDRGRVAYVFDGASFSNSTSKVQGRIRQALRDSDKVFCVECGDRGQSLGFTGKTLAAHYEARADSLAAEMPPRMARKRVERWQEVSALYASARDALAFFGYGTARLDSLLVKRKAGEAEAEATLKAQAEIMKARTAAKERRELKEKTARNVGMAMQFLAGAHRETPIDLERKESALATLPEKLRAEFVAAVRDNNARLLARYEAENAEIITKWRAGADVDAPRDCAVMLRVSGADMETSKGARVPLADAERTFRFISAVRAKGWHKNGETHAVGSYQLDAVNENGIVAGCHRVTWAEVERFAASQGWQEVQS